MNLDERPFPEACLRGITAAKRVTSIHGVQKVTRKVFFMNPTAAQRESGTHPASINWHDDDGAFAALKAANMMQFGVAVLAAEERAAVLMHLPGLGFERKAVTGNPYHGNMLLDITPDHKEYAFVVSGTLAAHARYLCADEAQQIVADWKRRKADKKR